MAIEFSASVVAQAVKTAAPVAPLATDPAAMVPAAADPAQVAQFRATLDAVSPVSGAGASGVAGAPGAVAAVGASAAPGVYAVPDASGASFASMPADLAPGATEAGAASSQATGPVSLGDTILKGLDHVRNHMRAGWSSAMAPLDPASGQLSAAGLLQFQAGVLQMGFESQMVGTIAGKTSQSIDQLVKMQ